jgi:hypothetical protein
MSKGIIIFLIGSVVAAVAADDIGFNRDIRPILSDKCFACHGPDAHDAKGDLQLHTLEAATTKMGKAKDRQAITPGSRDKSEMWLRISSTDPDEMMPPPDSHHELTAAEIELLGKWIDSGAPYQGHWAFQPIKRPAQGGSIDYFIDRGIKQAGLKKGAQTADRATLLRRLTQDLTGLPPTAAQIAAASNGPSIENYERVVDGLLASPAAAERLTVDWLDSARYADTNGYSIDDHRDMWIWRDWTIAAFQQNMSYDRFIVEQLAGDLLPNATEQQKVATGFLRNSMNTHEGGTIAEEYRVTYTADKVDTVSTVFMGLTMKCSQCHDHKYDPLTQKEYYQLYAFFNSSSEPGKGATNANTQPLIEAGSAICSPERVKQDVAHRLGELQYLAEHPPRDLAVVRDSWERATLPADYEQPGAAKTVESQTPANKPMPLFPKTPPKWIWAAANKTATTADFRRDVVLKTPPAEASMWVTCDDTAKIRVNGELVGNITLWTEWKTFPITLKKGRNVITVAATNGAGSPAGLLLSIAMRGADGKVTHVATDASWKAKIKGGEFANAAVVGKHGDAPWGNLYDGKPKGVKKQSPLYPALATSKAERTDAQWKAINDAFAKKNGAFKIYINQLNLESKVLKKTSETGRATVMVMNYKPRQTHILVRGAYDQPGDPVKEGVPAILPALATGADGAKTRLDLANWLVHPSHPLTARVIVNRYWQMIFGTGIVKTAEDFGAQGEYPSHPELLDWLAADFVEHGWNLRRLLKQIVMSETYRRSSASTVEQREKDPYNRLLARAPRYRMSAEFIRDSALAAAGLLSTDLGGPSVHPYQPDGLWAEVSHYGYPRGFTSQKFLPGTGKALYRRSMYTAWKRTAPPPSMAIFDAPSRETCTVRRMNTNTPLQALVLQNDPQFVEAARALGAQMRAAGSVERGIAAGAERVLGRTPTAAEARVLAAALQRYRKTYATRTDDAAALLSIGASPMADGDTPEFAAWTLVASTILNMDEAVTRQ